MTRLTAAFWVQAYLRRLALENIPAYILAHGDDTAGSVLVKLATLDGQARLFQRGFDLQTGDRVWQQLEQGTEEQIDTTLQRQLGFDPDLWVIELEDRAGRHFLDDYV
ncbi:MAG: DUF1491 family protein [Rhodobacteraceae bacterium]|nr:DUF1491 family protein [Paracoccaceae bacterium]